MAAIVVAGSDDPSPLTGDVASEPLVVDVSVSSRLDEYRVALTVNSLPPATLKAVGLSGRITDVNVASGATLTSGDPILAVGDVERLAMVADGPLWRDLGSGDNGDDVERLQRFLTDLGYDTSGADGSVGPSTLAAIRAFNNDYGWGQPSGLFRSGAVIWIGATDFAVGEVAVKTGDLIDGGQELAIGPEYAKSVTVAEPPNAPRQTDEDYVLVVEGISVPYVPGSDVIDDFDDAQAVANAVGDSEEPGGVVQRNEARQVKVVPATAVVTDQAGGRCVYVPDGSGFLPVAVEPIGGGVATVEIDASFNHETVLSNPRQVLGAPTCS
ncbi:MAG: peptidoglycan-binding domain-containing protein [Acidimicrobiia bacterium]